MRFAGKVAVVTGGASGMGAATARLLARDGAAVLIADLNSEAGQQVSKEIAAAGGQAEFITTDVSDPDSIHAMASRAIERFGKLNLAANVAGVPQQPTPLAQTTLELWDQIHAVNDRGLFLCLQAEIPRIRHRNDPAGRRRLAERLTPLAGMRPDSLQKKENRNDPDPADNRSR
jgi:NAD(P)-dependent dehydrogenase (short-subunit alcohol dehydrogenase family)